jgi:hypothetical protein
MYLNSKPLGPIEKMAPKYPYNYLEKFGVKPNPFDMV